MQFSPLAQYCSCTEDNQDWQCTLCAPYLYKRYDSWDNETEEEKVEEEEEEVEEVEENKRQDEVEEESQSLLAVAKQEAREELIFLGFNSRNVKK